LTTLAAFLNAIALVVITILIVWEAIQRFQHPQPVAGVTMMVIAVAGLLANVLAFWILHRGSEERNLNVRAAALHVLGDLLGSVGAIVAAVVILTTGWTPVDPILSVLVSCLVLRSAWRLLKESLNELLEGAPRSLDVAALQRDIRRSIPEVAMFTTSTSGWWGKTGDDAACSGGPAARSRCVTQPHPAFPGT
jgi:cobalt-zinc-cadmium efflux system protein